jgi:hypothetical protein
MISFKGESCLDKSFTFSWIFMWGLAYISAAILKPEILYGVPIYLSFIFFVGMGLSMLIGLLLNIKILLFATGLVEAIGGVGSWVGLIVWKAPWIVGYDPTMQISMAILDIVSSVFLFHYSIDFIQKNFLRKE